MSYPVQYNKHHHEKVQLNALSLMVSTELEAACTRVINVTVTALHRNEGQY